jgi:uncharacterized damage-inducible protein DinB
MVAYRIFACVCFILLKIKISMSLNTALIGELKHEGASTRKMLERIPADKFNWRPHDKSMTLGKLAKHIAELNMWIGRILQSDEFDFATAKFNLEVPEDTAGLLRVFEEKTAEANSALENATDEDFNKIWVIKRGEHIMFQLPKKIALRSFAYNHIYHHRGQLSVYLRMLDLPVPGMYGPSADEKF